MHIEAVRPRPPVEPVLHVLPAAVQVDPKHQLIHPDAGVKPVLSWFTLRAGSLSTPIRRLPPASKRAAVDAFRRLPGLQATTHDGGATRYERNGLWLEVPSDAALDHLLGVVQEAADRLAAMPTDRPLAIVSHATEGGLTERLILDGLPDATRAKVQLRLIGKNPPLDTILGAPGAGHASFRGPTDYLFPDGAATSTATRDLEGSVLILGAGFERPADRHLNLAYGHVLSQEDLRLADTVVMQGGFTAKTGASVLAEGRRALDLDVLVTCTPDPVTDRPILTFGPLCRLDARHKAMLSRALESAQADRGADESSIEVIHRAFQSSVAAFNGAGTGGTRFAAAPFSDARSSATLLVQHFQAARGQVFYLTWRDGKGDLARHHPAA